MSVLRIDGQVGLFEIMPRLRGRLDEFASQPLGQQGGLVLADVALGCLVLLVAHDDNGDGGAVFDAQDLMPELLDAVEGGAGGDGVNDQEPVSFPISVRPQLRIALVSIALNVIMGEMDPHRIH